MIPQMPFRFFGSLEGSFLTAAEPTSFAYSPHSSVYSSSTTLYAERGPRIIEPQPHASIGSESRQGGETDAANTPSQSSSRSSSRSSSPKRPASVDLLSSAPRMNATRMMG